MARGGRRYDRAGRYASPAIFVTFTIMGVAAIMGGKYLHFPAVTVTTVPILFMIAYMVMTLVFRGLRLQDEQVGDNLYYMGFLFTLTSLGMALYQFSDSQSIDGIVQSFGVAIASTIAGVLLRVMYTQMRVDPIEVERETRLELASMARLVKREMEETVRQMVLFRRANQQMVREGFEEISSATQDTGATITDTLLSIGTDTKVPLDEISHNIGQLLTQTTKTIEESTRSQNQILSEARKEFGRNISLFSKSVDRLGKKMSEFSMPDEVVEIKLEPTLEHLQKIIEQHGEQSQAILQDSAFKSEQLHKGLDAINALVPEIGNIASKVEQSTAAIEKMTKENNDQSLMIMQLQLDLINKMKQAAMPSSSSSSKWSWRKND
ncbi:MAG: hypothetical protein JKY49_05830 [Cohaesibacteraceae bacterium]|nr:hypothetical protein [Cohaesibacteraceae bacterium]MBL4876359.1 hypothetical protein [Cohaesibacteraceae bacterium]